MVTHSSIAGSILMHADGLFLHGHVAYFRAQSSEWAGMIKWWLSLSQPHTKISVPLLGIFKVGVIKPSPDQTWNERSCRLTNFFFEGNQVVTRLDNLSTRSVNPSYLCFHTWNEFSNPQLPNIFPKTVSWSSDLFSQFLAPRKKNRPKSKPPNFQNPIPSRQKPIKSLNLPNPTPSSSLLPFT